MSSDKSVSYMALSADNGLAFDRFFSLVITL